MRAITNAVALELRTRGIQVTLLIVDAGIEPLDGSTRPGVAPEALADPRRIADAVLFLANQDARSATHELQVTPLAEQLGPPELAVWCLRRQGTRPFARFTVIR